ncbi:response regulator, partial [Paenibacillus hemerocallicola]
ATTGTPIAEGRQTNATRGTQTADGPHPNAISEAPATAAAMDAQTAAAPAKPLVLLVDDDVTLLQMFKERLEAEGCLVLATPFPEKAIRWFYELKPDCIVLDVILPGHSGYDLLTVLQRSPQLFVPVILMSALYEKSDRMKAYVLGADDFLAKPIDPDEFAVRVLNKIRRKQSIAKLMPSNGSKHAGTGTALSAEGDADQGAEHWRIAILDDDPIIRNLLQRRLKDWRLDGKAPEVRTFADGSAFFEDDWHRRKGNYLLILDRMMPKINGIEVLTRLRADYPADRYRIIMLTGVGEQEEIAQAMRLGTDDYVIKPFRLPELEARMLRFLQGNKG